MAKLEQEAHRLAGKALEQQERAVTELRAHTSTLLTASSFIASFLGGRLLAGESLGAFLFIGLAFFGVSVALSLYVLMPRDKLVFALDGSIAYKALFDVREDEAEMDRRLAAWLKASREANHPIVRRLRSAFEAAIAALLVETASLATGLMVG
jgi:hypothetical protein